jgi:hypothetical protein
MNTLERASLILKLGTCLRQNGSWMGETHLQKGCYFLQTLLEVPTEFHFILYKHGPFSFDLREFLTYMESANFIQWEPQPPYGPSLKEGDFAKQLTDHFGSVADQYRSQIDFIARRLGTKNVAELERIATALYVTREEGIAGETRAQRIKELKPHIDPIHIQSALQELDAMIQEAGSH